MVEITRAVVNIEQHNRGRPLFHLADGAPGVIGSGCGQDSGRLLVGRCRPVRLHRKVVSRPPRPGFPRIPSGVALGGSSVGVDGDPTTALSAGPAPR